MTNGADGSAAVAVLEAFDDPLELREVSIRSPGEREVVVGVEYGGVCGTDLHIARGHLEVPLPLVLGHEGIGVVEQVGPGATTVDGSGVVPGQRIAWASSIACGRCWECRVAREPTLCSARRTYGVNRGLADGAAPGGSWSERMLLAEGTALVAVPPEVGSLGAMSLACAGPTILHALEERRAIRLGELVVVQGAGPVGMAAAIYAQLGGAERVVLVDRSCDRLALARELGIGSHHVAIGERRDGALIEAIAAATADERGADLVIECTGVPAAVDQGLRMCRRGGTYLVVGQYTDAGPAAINPHEIVYRQLDVLGSWAFTGAHLERYIASLPRVLERHELARLVTTFPLGKANEAMQAVAAGEVAKAVIAP